MSEAVQIALIAATPPTLTVIAGFIVSMWSHRKHERVSRATYDLLNGQTVDRIQKAYEKGLRDGKAG